MLIALNEYSHGWVFRRYNSLAGETHEGRALSFFALVHGSISNGRPVIIMANNPIEWYWYPASYNGPHWIVLAGAYRQDNVDWLIIHCSSAGSHGAATANCVVTGNKDGKYHITVTDFIKSLKTDAPIYYGWPYDQKYVEFYQNIDLNKDYSDEE